MEDYGEFLQYHYSQLRENEDRQSSQSVRSCSQDTSLIRFYGRPILPPLLSGDQRKEMKNHRDAAQRIYSQRKSQTDVRAAYIQSILHNVQLRKAPTMEEFFHEETIRTTADISHSQSTNNVFTPQDDDAIETKDSFMLCPPSGLIQENQRSMDIPALASTLYGAISTQDLTPSKFHQECFPIYKCEEKLVYQPITEPNADTSHPSISSGYVTYENVENCTTVDEANYPSSFFMHNTSNTITKIPDIINHPPIDGEELEKSVEAPFIFEHFNNDSSRKDVGSTSPQQDHVLCPLSGELVTSHNDETTGLPIAQSEVSHVGGAEYGEKSLSPPINDGIVQEQSQTGNDGPISLHFISLEPLETLTNPAASTASQPEILNQAKDIELVQNTARWAESASPPEEPYRMSLQALLKKSQEYRRRQQLLRNQAKNAKTQERAQREQLSKEYEESGLSDKENDEFPHTRKTSIEGRRNRERRVTMASRIQHSSPVQRSSKQAYEDEETRSRRKGIHVKEYLGVKDKFESESNHLSGDGSGQSDILTGGEEELVSKANQPDYSSEVGIQNKQVVSFPKPLPVTSADSSSAQEEFYLTRDQGITCDLSRSCSVERGKFQTIPPLQFCMSPIHCKSKAIIKGGGVDDGVCTPVTKLLANMPLNVDFNIVTEVNQGQVNKQDPCISPIVTPMGGGDEAKVLATNSDQAQQIEQLELNLSSLKVLISDLESTLRENHSQDNISNDSYDLCHKIIQHTSQANEEQHSQEGQDDFGYWVDRQSDDDVDRNNSVQDPMDNEGQRRESFDSCTNIHGDVGPEPSLNDPKDPSVLELEKSNGVVNVGGVLLAKTSAMEKEEIEGRDRGGLLELGMAPCKVQWSDGTSGTRDLDIISCGKYDSSKRQPSTGCISSVTQKMRVLDVFRKVQTETKIPHKASVLSDTSNQPKDRRNEVMVEGEESFHSLNQSYDVDAPSGLWLREGSELDLSSKEQGKQLTPENEGGGQGGASKVKRRLLMHTTDDNQQGKSGPDGGARLVSGPQCNTPTASLQKHGVIACLGRKQQQQLRLAHAAQVKALKDQQMRQQQEMLQALVERYHLLQSLSFPCHISSSRLGDGATSPMVPSTAASQPSISLPECYRPLVAAAVKGFLTRRLMRTDRVAQLLRTIKDTQQFLQVFQVPTPGRGESTSKQDLLLLKRVTMQLRSARYDVYDIFFSLSAGERMQLISWDRELVRERDLKRQSGEIGHSKGKSSLSAATQKALERKRGVTIQKKAAVKQRVVRGQTGSKAAPKAPLTPEEQTETKWGQFKANPRRVPKTTQSCRPR